MKFFVAITTLILSFGALSADSISCRDAVVEASAALGQPIEADSFSIRSPEEFTMSDVIFNALSETEQETIYMEYMPIEAMVAKMRAKLNGQISYINDSPFGALFYADALQRLRAKRDALVSCH